MVSYRTSIEPLSLRALLLAAIVLAAGVFLVTLARPARADSTITVNTKDDESTSGDGKCSLREAIENANSNNNSPAPDCAAGSGVDTIVFDPSVSGTIALGSSLPDVTDTAGLTIDGRDNGITVSGEKKARVLKVFRNGKLVLKNLTIAKGDSLSGGGSDNNFGGGIYNDFNSTLEVTNSTFSDNSSPNGGGIYNYQGTLTVTNSTFSGNSNKSNNGNSLGNGGGIFNQGGALTVTNSTFSDNVGLLGGAIFNNPKAPTAGTTNLSNTILANNTPNHNCDGPITDGGYNIDDDGSCISASTSKKPTLNSTLKVCRITVVPPRPLRWSWAAPPSTPFRPAPTAAARL